MDKQCMQKYVCELIGTMVLVLFGCGAAVLAGGEIGFMGISFAFGLALLIMAYAIGGISGCHINPAVTIGMLFCKRISHQDAIMYIIFQCLGAVIGAWVLMNIASGVDGYSVAANGLGQNGYAAGSPGGYTQIAGLITEVMATAIFMFVILSVTSGKENAAMAGLAIGLALVVIHLVTIPITGTSVNPARSFGPAIMAGGLAMEQLWLFWVGPILGAIAGSLAWQFVSCDKK